MRCFKCGRLAVEKIYAQRNAVTTVRCVCKSCAKPYMKSIKDYFVSTQPLDG